MTKSEDRFLGKSAIVTGGSSGIGRAVVERLAKEGATVIAVAAPSDEAELVRVVETLRSNGLDVTGVPADVADDATAGLLLRLLRDQDRQLQVLINNAGFAYFEEALEAPVDHLDRMWSVNVRGMYLLTAACARVMREVGGGAVVNTASTAGWMGEEFQAAYNVTKGGVCALTRSLAVDLAPYGVRVNAVAPGWVRTRRTAAVLAENSVWAKHRSRIPLDRPAEPSEVAAVHAFLASDDASYLTGTIVTCDGGMTAGFRYSNWSAAESSGSLTGLPPGIARHDEDTAR